MLNTHPHLAVLPPKPQPTPGDPNFRPEHWLLLGQSVGWLAAAQSWMQAHATDPGPLGWRLRRGLLALTDAAGLQAALESALLQQPPVLTVLAEAGAFPHNHGGVEAQLNQHWPMQLLPELAAGDMGSTQHPHVRIGRAGVPFASWTQRLAEADGGPAELWLVSGRSVWPRIARAQPDADFEDDAKLAFELWAHGILQKHPPRELDAIYGEASTFTQRLQDGWAGDDELQDQGTHGQEQPALQTVPGQAGRRPNLGLKPLALAAAPSRGAGDAGVLAGDFTRNDGIEPADRYTLRCPAPVAPGRKAGALQVSLDVAAERWADARALVLEIHADGHPVILLRWTHDAWPTPQAGLLRLQARADLGEAHRQALWQNLELWLGAAAR